MNATKYNDKINCLLSDCFILKGIVKKIKSDVNKYVWNLFKNQKLLKPNIIFLHCSKVVIPRFYGLPKLHKVSVSLRPIVSFINSPTTICQNFYLVFCLAYQ